MSHVLTLAKAQREIGWSREADRSGRRLRRYLLKREAATGKRIMIRLGENDGCGLRVTLSSLRRYCPELFGAAPGDANMTRRFREYIRGIDQRIAEKVAEHVAEHVEPRLDELWERDEQIMSNVTELAKRVETLARCDVATVSNHEQPPKAVQGVRIAR